MPSSMLPLPDAANWCAEDHRFMARALRLAEKGLYTTDPNPRVGCVLVQGYEVVGEGWHQRAGGPHAEIAALRDAGQRARDATAYVTLEPCSHHGRTPPCADALIEAGVRRVVAAMQDPNPRVAGQGLERLRRAGVEVSCGLLWQEAERLNPGFVKRMRSGLPFVRSKLAMSLDGRTALASGESKWITGEAARYDVHRLRARSSAIVTGIGTVRADDPLLTARLSEDTDLEQPARVILDSRLRSSADARVFRQAGRTLVLTTAADPPARQSLVDAGAEVMEVEPDASGKPEVSAVVRVLGQMEFNEVLFEAGATLNGALLMAGAVDEWVVYLAPCVLGDEARGLFRLPGLAGMADRPELAIVDARRVGRDMRLILRPIGPGEL
ncbi:bifunctional diaminohydroxyphosphoribosylaminopyrimidine deaminase/5-amino-6-(5-phosphoribosylamino)uracil reductase RibD [Methylococcus sp. ANG]|uniref:bifunctional diaminohydroxyphosphoribosylaminopyrimidine deaminase/5-amino-6-(5-phosphoribosylamino)uracil reductase RibD n=1 Tax=unclassified Methylococcus TaxID=2618889 RepID=UPI002104CE80|nr:bifunctional diaminohydroxyphosphoribosylaminopyrimidine deaminase/5-amino-6-(5-phosphoribosylamino)uracil reductase RibD [Methylococcus sp. Mc7]